MKALPAKLALAVFVPLALLSLLEGGLRLGGFGRNTDFFIPDEQRGVYRTNPHFTELFLAASFGLKPVNFRLSREKAPGTYRIFVIGESAAMGVPEPAFSIAPQLQAQLQAAEPGRPVEVFNLGVTAINSHAILRIVRQAVRFQPDLFVIYMGNNEVVGPYGPGSIFSRGVPPRWLIQSDLWLRSTRTGQLVQRAVGWLRPAQSNFKDWRGMEMFTRNAVTADDPRLARTYANFAANLADMLALARDAGAKVVLSTVAVNVRDSAPFASPPAPGLAAAQAAARQQDVDAAARELDLEETEAARQNLEQTLALDPQCADAHFRLARVLDAAGDLPAARAHYAQALQFDALRFRADARLNELIRQAARADPATVTLVDAARELGSEPGGPAAAPAGANLFFEHVHFRWEGNYALVRLLAPAAWMARYGREAVQPAWLDSAACADAVGFTGFGHLAMARGMAELTGRPPFTGQSSYADDRARLLSEIAATEQALAHPTAVASAVAKLDAALERDPQNPFLLAQAAAARLQTGDFNGALALNDRLASASPASPETAVQRAFLLQQLGRINEAEELLLHTAESAPFYFQTYGLLAELWSSTNQLPKALGYFARLTTRMPDSRGARSSYAQLLARSGDWAAAEQQWRRVLQLVPDDETALAPLIKYLAHTGQPDEVRKLVQAAYAYNPRDFDNDVREVELSEAHADAATMVQYLSALAASGPVNGRLYYDLAVQLAKLGRRDDEYAALAKAKRIATGEGDTATLQEVQQMMR